MSLTVTVVHKKSIMFGGVYRFSCVFLCWLVICYCFGLTFLAVLREGFIKELALVFRSEYSVTV